MQRITCKVCQTAADKSTMRKSARGRTLHHCRSCCGLYRCIHCNEVKSSATFKTHSGNRQFFFEDGEEIKIAVCYACDYKTNRERYARYDRSVWAATTIRAVVMTNFQRWRSKTRDMGLRFDLTREYLIRLWESQHGTCHYTGLPIDLENDRGGWSGPSLDRIEPGKGYTVGNVAWTTKLVNTTKGQRSAAEFVEFCQLVTARHQTAGSASPQE
jgi:hypothetical protein